jgi:uncharacterized membrane protein YccC
MRSYRAGGEDNHRLETPRRRVIIRLALSRGCGTLAGRYVDYRSGRWLLHKAVCENLGDVRCDRP